MKPAPGKGGIEVGVSAFKKILSVIKNVFREIDLFFVSGDLCGVYAFRQAIKISENQRVTEVRKLAFQPPNVKLVKGPGLAFSLSSGWMMGSSCSEVRY